MSRPSLKVIEASHDTEQELEKLSCLVRSLNQLIKSRESIRTSKDVELTHGASFYTGSLVKTNVPTRYALDAYRKEIEAGAKAIQAQVRLISNQLADVNRQARVTWESVW